MKSYGFRADGSELKTQWETVLYYLQNTEGARITSWQAIKDFGFTRLSDIVLKIKKNAGIVLARRDVSVVTRYGGKAYITEYWLPKENAKNK